MYSVMYTSHDFYHVIFISEGICIGSVAHAGHPSGICSSIPESTQHAPVNGGVVHEWWASIGTAVL